MEFRDVLGAFCFQIFSWNVMQSSRAHCNRAQGAHVTER